MQKQVIHVTAYPKAGVTWLVRLLSDLLDSPQTGVEITSPLIWGVRSDGGYEIVKTHWQNYEYSLDDHRLVLTQRDPRDIAISAMYYRKQEPTDKNLMGALEVLIATYEPFLRGWLDSGKYDVLTRYEELTDPFELSRIVFVLTGTTLSLKRVEESMGRQAFSALASRFPHSMRKGIVGDWKNHFKKEHGEYITEHLGQLMLEQGYIKDLDWWKELP